MIWENQIFKFQAAEKNYYGKRRGQKIKQVFFLYRGQRARDESGMCA
jgi:hypothetical protein